jgi:HK97 family phage portal protein
MKWPKFLTKQNPVWSIILNLWPGKYAYPDKNYERLSKAGYQNCIDAYACINLVADTAADIPWYLTNGDGTEEIDQHPLLDVIEKPNPKEGGIQFRANALKYLLISGNSYVNRVGPLNKKSPPRELYSLRPDRMQVIKGNAVQPVAGYEYAQQKPDIDPELVLHLKYFHPTDDWYGLSPLAVAAVGIDISNLLMEWNAGLLKNDCRPPGAFIGKFKVDDEERKRLEAEIAERYTGSENAGKPLLLFGGDVDYKQFAFNPRDMDYLNSDKMTTRKIARVYGVAPELIGDSEAKTFANYQEARLALYMDRAIPLAQWLVSEYNNWLTPLFGDDLRLALDLDAIVAIQEKRGEQYAKLQGAYWLTLNEKRVACGYDEMKGGDVLYIPLGLTAQGQAPASPAPAGGTKSTSPKESKNFWKDPKRKSVLYKNFVQRIEAKEKGFVPDAQAYLKRQAQDVKDKASKLASLKRINYQQLFNEADESKKYADKFKPRYQHLFVTAGEAGMNLSEGKLYDFSEMEAKAGRFTYSEQLAKKMDELLMQSARYINEETMRQIKDFIIASEESEKLDTVEETAQKLYAHLEDLSTSRARNIARTETTKVENFGNIEGYGQTEFVDGKGWMCSFVPASRPEHMAADSQEVKLDEDFQVGGQAMAYPGDPRGDAGNVCNCLCGTYPVVGIGE